MAWSVNDIPDQTGKTFVVTGGNAGIGYATTRMLAERGGSVIIGCRDQAKAKAAIASIRERHPGSAVEDLPLDLASFVSVRSFAGLIGDRRIDVLINNAGIMMAPRSKTVDGFELQFGTNVLGHHLLTGLLLPTLTKTQDARIVTVSSLAHWANRMDLDNLNGETSYGPTHNYEQSKLANLILAYELQRRLDRAGIPLLSIGVHPGVTRSELGRHAGWASIALRLAGQSIDDGALPSLMAAVDPAVRGGDYVGPMGFRTWRGPPGRQESSAMSHDGALGAALWDRVTAMTGIAYP